jgi:cytochrome c-type biogenesis protein CcmH/NrfF
MNTVKRNDVNRRGRWNVMNTPVICSNIVLWKLKVYIVAFSFTVLAIQAKKKRHRNAKAKGNKNREGDESTRSQSNRMR